MDISIIHYQSLVKVMECCCNSFEIKNIFLWISKSIIYYISSWLRYWIDAVIVSK